MSEEDRDLLKSFVSEAVKGKVAASPAYMKKEVVREKLQSMIADQIAAGAIPDQAALDEYLKDINISMTALKMIPFEIWKKLAGVPEVSKSPTPPMNLPLKLKKHSK